jgi:hypothetical protein
MAEKDDIMLERDVRSPPAAAASATSAAEATATTATEATATAPTEATTAASETAAAETATAYARMPTGRLEPGGSTRTDIRERIGAASRTTGTRPARARSSARRPLPGARPPA